jgi:hypothetical protein
MIIVSGVSRSGTSLMMDICRSGGLKIVGDAFPQERKPKTPEEACMQYLSPKRKANIKKDMNPNGFWEDIYAVQGMFYRWMDAERLDRLINEHNTAVKIVARGIIHTDPKYVDKIILMVRHPKAVATSQERMTRKFPLREMNNETVNGPEFYLNVAIPMCAWLQKYQKPTLVVEYEKLVSEPLEQIKRVAEFVGVPFDIKKARRRINVKLNRSRHKRIVSEHWEKAIDLYKHLKKGEFEDGSKISLKSLQQYGCPRCGILVDHERCRKCLTDEKFRERFKKQAIHARIKWEREPCLFECGLGDLEAFKTIEDSIQNNSWRTE